MMLSGQRWSASALTVVVAVLFAVAIMQPPRNFVARAFTSTTTYTATTTTRAASLSKNCLRVESTSCCHRQPRRGTILVELFPSASKLSAEGSGKKNVSVHHRLLLWKTMRNGGTPVRSRFDTLDAAGIIVPTPNSHSPLHQKTRLQPQSSGSMIAKYSTIGFLGHTGLLLVSTILVMVATQLIKTIQQQSQKTTESDIVEEEEVPAAAGVMNRCPWPFIFSHDPVQGMKDPPTWIVITWIVLWRILKVTSKTKI